MRLLPVHKLKHRPRIQHQFIPTPKMYQSLLLPWSPHPTPSETLYRSAGLLKTKGTIYIPPPPTSILISTFNTPPRPKTRMSSGAVALCKHFERGIFNRYGTTKTLNTTTSSPTAAATIPISNTSTTATNVVSTKPSSEHRTPHPFWTLPTGSNENKSAIAAQILNDMLERTVWKNVMLLHVGVAVYEIRNEKGYGMRWTLELAELAEADDGEQEVVSEEQEGEVGREEGGNDEDEKTWKIKNVSFRGFLEPIEGLDHELPHLSDNNINDNNIQ